MGSTPFALPTGLQPDWASPPWLNKADNEWELTAAAMVGLQSVPGLVILYGSMVKKKWAVNSAFMALYAFAAVLICWVLWGHRMSFGGTDKNTGTILQKPQPSLNQKYLLNQFKSYSQEHPYFLPNADYVFYQFAFAAITVILLAGSLLARMNFYAWMLFVPLWLTLSYTVGAHTIWGSGFLEKQGIFDFSGGYVIHLSSGVAGFTAAYWVIIIINSCCVFVYIYIYKIHLINIFGRWDQGILRIGNIFHQTTLFICWEVQDSFGWDGVGSMVDHHFQLDLLPHLQFSTLMSALLLVSSYGFQWT